MRLMGYSVMAALIVGGALSVTAEGTTLKALFDMNALKTRIGTLILGAGILDDIFEILFLVMTISFISHAAVAFVSLSLDIILFIAVIYLIYLLLPLFFHIVGAPRSKIDTFSLIIIICISIALMSEYIGLGALIGAFIAGLLVSRFTHKEKHYEDIIENMKYMTFGFIIPFFFISIGLQFDTPAIIHSWWLAAVLLIVATAGKFIGAAAIKPFSKLGWRAIGIIGWGMNSRGAVELVIADIALQNGLIGSDLFSAIVSTAVITSLMFPVALRQMLKKDRKALQ
jgi:Kef-type K+ transport system membrane component KefB